MTNCELEQKLKALILAERKITNEILDLLNLAMARQLYLDLGFASLFDWLTRGFGYSNAAAYRRIEAAKLLNSVPDAAEKLQSGKINLSNLARAQTIIRAQEKISGEQISTQRKIELVSQIENKSTLETEKILYATFPETAAKTNQDRRTILDENKTRHMMTFSKQTTADLNRAKELLSHTIPDGSDSDVIAYALKFLLDKLDPLRKVANNTQLGSRRVTIQKARAKCSYINEVTGQTCGSSYQVQIDHIIPKALGGSDNPENLRVLCRKHNILMGEKILGKEQMNRWRTGRK